MLHWWSLLFTIIGLWLNSAVLTVCGHSASTAASTQAPAITSTPKPVNDAPAPDDDGVTTTREDLSRDDGMMEAPLEDKENQSESSVERSSDDEKSRAEAEMMSSDPVGNANDVDDDVNDDGHALPNSLISCSSQDDDNRKSENADTVPKKAGLMNTNSSALASTIEETLAFSECYPNVTQQTLHHVNSRNITPSESIIPTTKPEKEWEKGMLTLAQYAVIIRYMRVCGTFPVGVAVLSGITSAFVFSHKKLRNSTTLLVIAFNLAETAKALFFVINRVWKSSIMGVGLTWSSPYAKFFINVVTCVPDGFGRTGITLNGLITVDRFLVLALPLKTMNKKPIRHPKIVIVVVVIAMALWQLPLPLIIHFQGLTRKSANVVFTEDQIVTFVAIFIPEGMRIYRILNIVGSVLFRYLLLLASLLFNILTIVRLFLHQKTRQKSRSSTKMTKSQSVTRQTNVAIVVSSLVFTILVSLNPLVRILGLLHPLLGDAKREMLVYLLLQEGTLMMDNLSSVANIITYFRMSSLFRECFWLRFLCAGHVSPRKSSNLQDKNLKAFCPSRLLTDCHKAPPVQAKACTYGLQP